MLGVLLSIIVALMFVIALILILLILFQDNKGGLTGALGTPGAESALGAKATEKISKLTAYFVAAFLLLSLLAGIIQVRQRHIALESPGGGRPVESGAKTEESDDAGSAESAGENAPAAPARDSSNP